jgi:hypothetical protein
MGVVACLKGRNGPHLAANPYMRCVQSRPNAQVRRNLSQPVPAREIPPDRARLEASSSRESGSRHPNGLVTVRVDAHRSLTGIEPSPRIQRTSADVVSHMNMETPAEAKRRLLEQDGVVISERPSAPTPRPARRLHRTPASASAPTRRGRGSEQQPRDRSGSPAPARLSAAQVRGRPAL